MTAYSNVGLSRLQRLVAIACFLILAFSLIPFVPAQAAAFAPGCTGSVGDAAALQAAVITAGSNGAADMITLVSGCVYSLAGTLTVNADGGNPLSIKGNGATINGNSLIRVVYVHSSASLTLNGVIISSGFVDSTAFGGGIYNAGNLTVTSSTVSDSQAGEGGGIYNLGTLRISSSIVNNNKALNGAGIFNTSSLDISSSTMSGNKAADATDHVARGGNGGGIYSTGTVVITDSTLTSNQSSDSSPNSDNSGGSGGGIFSANTLTITGSTLSSNKAMDVGNDGGAGGGIFIHSGTSTISTSTIANNTATDSGGGIDNLDTLIISESTFNANFGEQGGAIASFDGALTLSNSTFAANVAFAGGGMYVVGGMMILTHSTLSENVGEYGGGGIYLNNAPAEIGNTLIAANHVNSSPSGIDINGTFTSQGYNLVGSSSNAAGFVASDLTDAAATPLNLGALANNGGATRTMALLNGSIAINHGSLVFAPPPNYDQRGVGFPRVRQGRLDIGAYEAPGADVVVQLALQGRPTAPNVQWVTTAHVEIRPQGGGAPVKAADYVSDSSGQLTIFDLPTGSYNVWIKGTHTLGVVQVVTVVAGSNTLTTAILKEGDANDDNVVNISDFSILAAAFGKASGNAGYDAGTDFNGDNIVNINDFSLLAANFGQAGTP